MSAAPPSRREKGETTRRAILGDAHVDAAKASVRPEETPFQDLITESAWGTLWASEAIPARERSMLTLAILAATGAEGEIALHLRAARNTGASRDDIAQAFLHAAIYAGVPRANRAFAIAREIWDAEDGA